jgi:hypothetical protein
MLNDYFSQATRHVFEFQGTLVKYIGDAVFAIWGAPLPRADHATLACRAALALARDESTRKDGLKTRIGVHTGTMVVGNLGSAQRFDYTAIGDAVNLASRIEGAEQGLRHPCPGQRRGPGANRRRLRHPLPGACPRRGPVRAGRAPRAAGPGGGGCPPGAAARRPAGLRRRARPVRRRPLPRSRRRFRRRSATRAGRTPPRRPSGGSPRDMPWLPPRARGTAPWSSSPSSRTSKRSGYDDGPVTGSGGGR